MSYFNVELKVGDIVKRNPEYSDFDNYFKLGLDAEYTIGAIKTDGNQLLYYLNNCSNYYHLERHLLFVKRFGEDDFNEIMRSEKRLIEI